MSESSLIEPMPRCSISAIVRHVADIGFPSRVSSFSDAVISTRSMWWLSESMGCATTCNTENSKISIINALFTLQKYHIITIKTTPINVGLFVTYGDIRIHSCVCFYLSMIFFDLIYRVSLFRNHNKRNFRKII